MLCNYSLKKENGYRVLTIDCENCRYSSSLLDENCRRNIIQIILKEAEIDRLVLHHPLVKVFDGSSLNFLKSLSKFVEGLREIDLDKLPQYGKEACIKCNERRRKKLEQIIEISLYDPILAFQKLKKEGKGSPVIFEDECNRCKKEYAKILRKVMKKGFEVGNKESSFYYIYRMQPYVRPIFFDTYIHLSPPSDAVFLRKYEIRKEEGRPLKVSLYMLSTRPEKLYFVIPMEYSLSHDEIKILQKVKKKLAKHRPMDASFMDAEVSREYFFKFAKREIKKVAEEEGISMDISNIEILSDIFAKYTAGLGILEDLLMDENIQDIYINAPVENNPLHIIWQGEEYTTNIYLSQDDVEALSTRFRSLSGRPFSEGSPILDMSLEMYNARVSAISKPLTNGIAFAIRRHSIKPWTLPKFISCKMLSPLAAALLSFFVDGNATILIAGSRGAGKTSLLSSLILEIPQRYRILTIEDTPELPIEKLQSLGYKIQSLITQPITAEGGGIEAKKALRTALRLGESVLILGEVRGEETKVLFEAMRIGAAGNLVMGTIHGATTRDVFDRIVYDIGVAPSSFKATDIVVIASPIRIGGGIEKERRVVQIAEVTKSWDEADVDKIFADIMIYEPSKDELEATDLFDMGQSEVIGRIAREWGITIEKAVENIILRKKIKESLAYAGNKNSKLLEADAVRDANNAFWLFVEESRLKHGSPDYKEVENKWMRWFRSYRKNV